MCQPSVLELKYTRLRRTGESRYPDVFELPGFRVALAIALARNDDAFLLRNFDSGILTPTVNLL